MVCWYIHLRIFLTWLKTKTRYRYRSDCFWAQYENCQFARQFDSKPRSGLTEDSRITDPGCKLFRAVRDWVNSSCAELFSVRGSWIFGQNNHWLFKFWELLLIDDHDDDDDIRSETTPKTSFMKTTWQGIKSGSVIISGSWIFCKAKSQGWHKIQEPLTQRE